MLIGNIRAHTKGLVLDLAFKNLFLPFLGRARNNEAWHMILVIQHTCSYPEWTSRSVLKLTKNYQSHKQFKHIDSHNIISKVFAKDVTDKKYLPTSKMLSNSSCLSGNKDGKSTKSLGTVKK